MTYPPDSVKVEAQVVDGVQNLGQHFIGRVEVTQIGAPVARTNPARAVRVQGAIVARIAGLLDRDLALGRK